MSEREFARYVYVSGDGKLQILYELSPDEIMQISKGTFVIPENLPEDGNWGVITRNDGLHNMDAMMNEFRRRKE